MTADAIQYDFLSPQRIVFGWGRRREVGALARSLGQRVFVIPGSRTLEKSGTIGEHNDPKPITDIQHFKVDSFQLLVMDPATGAHAAVVPVGPPGSGQSEVQVVHTSEKHPLAGELAKAQTADRRLILPADHPIAKAAFVNQT